MYSFTFCLFLFNYWGFIDDFFYKVVFVIYSYLVFFVHSVELRKLKSKHGEGTGAREVMLGAPPSGQEM